MAPVLPSDFAVTYNPSSVGQLLPNSILNHLAFFAIEKGVRSK